MNWKQWRSDLGYIEEEDPGDRMMRPQPQSKDPTPGTHTHTHTLTFSRPVVFNCSVTNVFPFDSICQGIGGA